MALTVLPGMSHAEKSWFDRLTDVSVNSSIYYTNNYLWNAELWSNSEPSVLTDVWLDNDLGLYAGIVLSTDGDVDAEEGNHHHEKRDKLALELYGGHYFDFEVNNLDLGYDINLQSYIDMETYMTKKESFELVNGNVYLGPLALSLSKVFDGSKDYAVSYCFERICLDIGWQPDYSWYVCPNVDLSTDDLDLSIGVNFKKHFGDDDNSSDEGAYPIFTVGKWMHWRLD